MNTPVLAVLALTVNAFVWGTSWWPFRQLEALGVHPLWATVLIYGAAVLLIVLVRPRAFVHLLRTPVLWVLVAASGTTNAAFNWGVVIGDVVRVVLLFYLMPLWAVLLARWLLHEPLTRLAAARIALALGGAMVVLWPEDGGWPLPSTLADWLGVIGGFAFALNNVMLRREAHQPEEARAVAMFFGGAFVAALLAGALTTLGQVAPIPAASASWLAWIGGLALLFLIGNLALQYGAARLPANVTAVVMLVEVIFASVSAVALGGGQITTPLLVGGSMILAATVLASRPSRPGDTIERS